MEIYLKTEPAGEVSAGKLTEEEVAQLKSLFRTDEMRESHFVQYPENFDNLGHAYGIFWEGGIDDSQMRKTKTISMPKNDGDTYEDGFYITYTGLSKCSLYFYFDPDDEDEDESKLTYEYTEFDFGALDHFMYGELYFDVITKYLYNGEEIPESIDAELVDRGIDHEVIIFQAKDDEIREIYRVRNYGKETWGDFIE